MRGLILLCTVGMMGGCAAPHAVRVRCDRHLTPINAPDTAAASGIPARPGAPVGAHRPAVVARTSARRVRSAGR